MINYSTCNQVYHDKSRRENMIFLGKFTPVTLIYHDKSCRENQNHRKMIYL